MNAPAKTRRAGAEAAPALSREGIVDAALALTDEAGLDALSTRKIASRLGCEAMSIYHHFPSKRHLLDAMVDRALLSLEMPPEDMAPIDRLRFTLHSYRDMAHRHAALYPLIAVHRLNTPTGVRMIEGFIGMVADVVPDVELAARHFRTLGYYITGAALDETAGYARGPSAAEPVDASFIAEHCPRLAASAPYFQAAHWQVTFELGLEALLDRVQADAATHAAEGSGRRARA
ncbi:MAG: TetR family transcriptional regulator [Rhizobacter sp.]|nr:TetR family transcriptional regulator [Burkholderiaceae bacterium]MCO5123886.1 TetR family transcriptional regulator [Rhizobacter sp.]